MVWNSKQRKWLESEVHSVNQSQLRLYGKHQLHPWLISGGKDLWRPADSGTRWTCMCCFVCLSEMIIRARECLTGDLRRHCVNSVRVTAGLKGQRKQDHVSPLTATQQMDDGKERKSYAHSAQSLFIILCQGLNFFLIGTEWARKTKTDKNEPEKTVSRTES